jgi:hypothetical protein
MRLPFNYSALLLKYPLLTNMATSAAIWATGDVAAQYLEHAVGDKVVNPDSDKHPQNAGHIDKATTLWQFDWQRFTVQTVYAGVIWAPIGHWWYNNLDAVVSKYAIAGSGRFVALKLMGELALLHPISLCVYFTCIGIGGGDTMSQISQQLRRDFAPTLLLE